MKTSKTVRNILLKELKRRKMVGERSKEKVQRDLNITLKQNLSVKQYNLVTDPSKFIVVRCSRRAGKTHSLMHLLRTAAVSKPNQNILYVTKTRKMAHEIVWSDLGKILGDVYKDSVVFKVSDLRILFPNGSKITLGGLSNADEGDKYRGQSYDLVLIDEAQMFPTWLSQVVREVFTPTFITTGGRLILTGTPNSSCSGYFYEADNHDHHPSSATATTWSKHGWNLTENEFVVECAMRNNPNIKSPEDIILSLVGVNADLNSPSIRREYFGEWVRDKDCNVYAYDEDLLDHTLVDDIVQAKRNDFSCVIGIDLGYTSGNAIVVVGYLNSKNTKIRVMVAEQTGNITVMQLADKLKEYRRVYSPHTMVVDAGALGGAITQELNTTHSLALVPAKKSDKSAYIAMLNSRMRNGDVYVDPKSALATEMKNLRWLNTDYERGILTEDKTSSTNHLCDAFLYATRYIYSNYTEAEAPLTTSNQHNHNHHHHHYYNPYEDSEHGY
jgi:hypothetical protein